MKNVRQIRVLAVALIIALGVIGCRAIFPSNKKLMLKHLEEKYGQKFISLGVEQGGIYSISDLFTSDTYYMSCYPAGGDSETDRVKVNMSGKTSFEDNYFSIIIREDVEAEVLDALSGFPLPIKVYAHGGNFFDDIFDGTKTYADYKKWRAENNASGWLDVTVCVALDGLNESEKEVYANQIFNSIEENGSPWNITARFYPSDVFEKITRKNYIDLLGKHGDMHYATFSKLLNLPRHFDAIIHEGVETELRDTLSDLPIPMRAYFRGASSYPDEFHGGSSFSDLKRWIRNGYAAQLSVTVCAFTDQLDDAEKEVYARQIFDRIEEDGLPWHIEVLFFPTEALREVTRANQDELAAQYRDEYAIFSKSVNEASSTAP